MTGSIKYQSLLTGAFTCVPDENKAGVRGGVGIANLASVYTVYEIARLSTRCKAPSLLLCLSLSAHTGNHKLPRQRKLRAIGLEWCLGGGVAWWHVARVLRLIKFAAF